MARESPVPIFALLETVDADLVRVQLLPPLSLAVVAQNWAQAQKLVKSKLNRHIREQSPERWAQFRARELPGHRIINLRLSPPKDDPTWTQEILVDVDYFHWPVSKNHRQWITQSSTRPW